MSTGTGSLKSKLNLGWINLQDIGSAWTSTLAMTSPRWLKRMFINELPTAILRPTSDGLELVQEDGFQAIRPGSKEAARLSKGHKIDIALRPDQIFQRQRWLPLASSRRWRSTLDLDFQTNAPFSANEVVTDVFLVDIAPTTKRGLIKHGICKVETIRDAIAKCQQAGLTPSKIGVFDPDTSSVQYNFLPRSSFGQLSVQANWANLCLFGLILGLGLAGTTNYLSGLTARRAEVSALVLASKERALPILQQQEEAVNLVAQDEFLRSNFLDRRRFNNVYEALTQSLPDGTRLESLNYDPDRVRITGYTDNSDTIIASLESAQLINRAAFSAPLRRNTRFNSDHFQIEISLSNSVDEIQLTGLATR